MNLNTILLLALLVSIDNFYAGIIYQESWGRISSRDLLLIGVYNFMLFSLAAFLGRMIILFLGVELAKLFSVILLLISSILFYLTVANENKVGSNIKEWLKSYSGGALFNLEEIKEDRLTDLISLSIVSSIDTVIASFLVAISSTRLLTISLSFTLLNLLAMQLGNLLLSAKEDKFKL